MALSGHDVAGVVTKPVYVSAGAGMDLATATALTRACSRHRVPEPIRAADVASRAWLRERQGASEGGEEGGRERAWAVGS